MRSLRKLLTTTVLPSNVADKTLVWASGNTKLATVSSTGKVTAKAPGEATISVKVVSCNQYVWTKKASFSPLVM
ncbi:MAG: Ig-like domain-containing protein, partial [Clostridia bacterium]